jgi:hypothetical protein
MVVLQVALKVCRSAAVHQHGGEVSKREKNAQLAPGTSASTM